MNDPRINHPYYNPPPKPKRMRLILPFVIFGVLLALYTAYWVFASSQIKSFAEQWIVAQEEAGYEIETGRIGVGGYPFRFSLDVRSPDISTPLEDGGWQARFDRFKASAMPWNFSHWIMDFKGPIEVSSSQDGVPGLYEITTEKARMSISSASGSTQRIGIEFGPTQILAIEGPEPGITGFESFALAGILQDDDVLLASVETSGIVLKSGQLETSIENSFGRTADLIRFDGRITSWSALASEGDIAQWARNGGGLFINGSELAWGPALIAGQGELTLDIERRPIGRLSVIIGDPESLVEALVSAELVESGQGDALRLAAMMAPRREGGIALPLRLQEGGIFLGPARVGSVGSLN